MKLTAPQKDMLAKLAQVDGKKYLAVSGHASTKCHTITKLGLAEWHGSDGCLTFYFTITDKGRKALADLAPGHTDLMVSPESLDEYMAANPLPEPK